MSVNLVRKGGIEKAKFVLTGFMGAVPGMSSMATAMIEKEDREGADSHPAGSNGDGPVGRSETHRLQDDLRHDGT